MKMQIRKFSFISKVDRVPIRGICIVPEHPIGIVQMVHGMGEHKGRFRHFMEKLAEHGYITCMHDTRGHGNSLKSIEDMGYFYAGKERGCVEDIYYVTIQMKKAYPGLPLVLYGHSLGALMVRSYLQRHESAVDGVILEGCPSYNLLVPFMIPYVKVLQKMLGERCRISLIQKWLQRSYACRFSDEDKYLAWLSSDDAVVKAFKADSRCTFVYTLNGFETLLRLEYATYGEKLYETQHASLPILFVSGMDDPCYTNERMWKHSLKRMEHLGYKNVKEIRYEGMRHELHNEPGRAAYYKDLCEFLSGVNI